jgi:hypothetical protein
MLSFFSINRRFLPETPEPTTSHWGSSVLVRGTKHFLCGRVNGFYHFVSKLNSNRGNGNKKITSHTDK